MNWPAVTSIITALTAIGALVFTALSLNATRDQVSVAEQSQFTDRYSRAIEQLGQQGSDQLQIRLGAIYALERLARDSPRDQTTIIAVLNTFVRTSVPPTEPHVGRPRPAFVEFKCPADAPETPLPDVQAALLVLGRRDTTHDDETIADLSNICLRGARLEGVDLSDMQAQGADLSNALLTSTNLNHSNLESADLTGANLERANLSNSNLARAAVFSATLRRADLTHASLLDAFFNGADLRSANLRSANLSGADLTSADLGGAELTGADLTRVNLTGVFLSEVDLTDVKRGSN